MSNNSSSNRLVVPAAREAMEKFKMEAASELVVAVEQFIHYYNHQRRQHKLNRMPPATYRSFLEAA